MAAVDVIPSGPPKATSPSATILGSEDFAWRVLWLLNLFRLGLGALLLGVFFLVIDPHIVGESIPQLALMAMLTMIGFSVANSWLLRERKLSAPAQGYLQLGVDLATIAVLMHASGGVSSGVGGLLIVSVGALALLVSLTLFFGISLASPPPKIDEDIEAVMDI